MVHPVFFIELQMKNSGDVGGTTDLFTTEKRHSDIFAIVLNVLYVGSLD